MVEFWGENVLWECPRILVAYRVWRIGILSLCFQMRGFVDLSDVDELRARVGRLLEDQTEPRPLCFSIYSQCSCHVSSLAGT